LESGELTMTGVGLDAPAQPSARRTPPGVAP